MRLFIHYDEAGNIISASKASVLHESLEHPYGDVAENAGVLEVEPNAALDALDCHEIVEQYVVDVEQKKLKKKTARRTSRK
jgi:hypothetical protein